MNIRTFSIRIIFCDIIVFSPKAGLLFRAVLDPMDRDVILHAILNLTVGFTLKEERAPNICDEVIGGVRALKLGNKPLPSEILSPRKFLHNIRCSDPDFLVAVGFKDMSVGGGNQVVVFSCIELKLVKKGRHDCERTVGLGAARPGVLLGWVPRSGVGTISRN